MKEPLVSIIIPFYNDERFLERAVVSAIEQTYTNIELILVNDGSTDSSLKIASSIESKNHTMTIVNSERHSIGRARNIGIQKALGQYIVFLDSDDELEKDAVQQLVFAIETQNVDAVIGAFGLYNIEGQIVKKSRTNNLPNTVSNIEAAIALCKEKIARVVWAKLFKAEIARQVSFPEGIWFEDGPFLMEYFYKCTNDIAITDVVTIKHFCRPDSVTRKLFTQKRIEDTYSAFEIEWKLTTAFAQQRLISADLFSYYQRALMNCLVILTMDRTRVANLKDVENRTREILKKFLNESNQNKINMGPRTRMDKGFIRLNELIGWQYFFKILPIFKRNLFQKIATIRSL